MDHPDASIISMRVTMKAAVIWIKDTFTSKMSATVENAGIPTPSPAYI